jgi:hypothetical protein
MSSFSGVSSRAFGQRSGLAAPVGYNSIASTTVGATSVPTITFSGIPQNYKHLQIRAVVKAVSPTNIAFSTNLNSWVGRHQWYFFPGNTGTSREATDNQFIYNDPNVFAVGIIDYYDYSNTNKAKTFRSQNGYQNGDVASFYGLISGLETSTGAITSITLTGVSYNMIQNTTVSLYGIAG